MKVTIEFSIDKRLDLVFAKLIESIGKLLDGLSIKWKYKVETSIEEYLNESNNEQTNIK
jgi:hypothetical protein